jgi:epoxyqueuosine reductase
MKLTNEIILTRAKNLGFDLVGFAKAEILEIESVHLKEWVTKGFQAGMKYMERNFEKRKDIRKVFPDAKSIISLGLNYYTPFNYRKATNTGKVSRYAWGKDYHLVLWKKLEELEKELSKLEPGFKSISYVDTGPVMDKAWAVKAGIGWLGKHTNVINMEKGSWFFIASLITNYEFDYSKIVADHCGSCTACIDACPTNAINDDYVLDSNKCISYLTIENKGKIPETFTDKFDNWIFGCDICQDVCPWNIKFSENCEMKEFNPLSGKTEMELNKVLEMSLETFKNKFEKSPIKRAKLSGLKRNAEFILHSKKFKTDKGNS